MRRSLLLSLLILLAACQPKTVLIETEQGTLCLQPLADDAIRVRLAPEGTRRLEELIFTQDVKAPKFSVERSDGSVTVRTARMSAEYSTATQTMRFLDAGGRVLLEERPGGRSIVPAEIQDEPAYAVSQTFLSPEGEHLYGTGQFQDGYLDIRGLTRRLTQVNTQISLPLILSSHGYGLLWHNYGRTDFNPAESSVTLSPASESGASETVNATGTAGNRRERRFFQAFTGEIELPADGEYALLFDVGRTMARKQYLAIDGEPVIDITNTWLPPTAAVKVRLSAGKHQLQAEGTRGDARDRMGRLKNGVARLAEAFPDAPVAPVWLQGAGRVLPKGAHVPVPMNCTIHVGAPIAWPGDRARLMTALREALDALKAQAPPLRWREDDADGADGAG